MRSSNDQSGPRRTLCLAGALIACSVPVLALVQHVQPGRADPPVQWWMLAIAFAVSELFVFHMEVREEAHTFSFSELPMVTGLFFASPMSLVVGRMVGEAVFLFANRHRSPLKVAFNLAMFLAECAIAVSVFHLLFGGPDLVEPRAWVGVLTAVALADLLGVLAVSLVIRWHSGPSSLTSTTIAAALSAAANGSLAVIASLLARHNPLALVLMIVLATILYVAYRGYANLHQRYANLHLLYDFTDAVSGASDSTTLTSAVLSYARTLLRAETAEIVLFAGEDTPAMRFVATDDRPLEQQDLPPGLLALLRHDDVGSRSILARRSTRDATGIAYLQALSLRDCIAVPLQMEGAMVGAISVGNRLADVSTFDVDDLRLFEALANHASIALQNDRLIEKLRGEVARRQHEALHDALTGLPNRTLFIQRCAEAIDGCQSQGGARVGVLLMDVDRFKDVNDTLGHDTGDEMLQELGRRLSASAPAGATVARLGGDEFAVLLPTDSSRERLLLAAEHLRQTLSAALRIRDLELAIEVSAGLAIAPEHGADPLTLLQRADIAMYGAKGSHSGLEVYAADRDHHTPARLAMATELRQALADRALEVYFQPKSSLEDGRIIGAEALVRWQHPERGFVSPAEFIPVAERTDLIIPLTKFVLDEAIAQCARWHASGHQLSVAINIAVRSLLDAELLEQLKTAVPRSGIGYGSVILEVTESGIMTDAARAIDMLDQIASLGVQLSVDDFGTGYSSLSYLQRLPVHEVKIDRSFVFNAGTDAGDAAIVRSIVELGHSMGLRVVAEGVENQLTLDQLRVLGCDVAQGYFLSRPISASQFSSWLSARQFSRA